jgi:hypothetical protein
VRRGNDEQSKKSNKENLFRIILCKTKKINEKKVTDHAHNVAVVRHLLLDTGLSELLRVLVEQMDCLVSAVLEQETEPHVLELARRRSLER